MSMSPLRIARCVHVLLLALAAGAAGWPARTAPIPPQDPVRLDNPITVPFSGVEHSAFTVLADNESVALVGSEPRKPNDHDTPRVDLPPAGVLINLRTKAVRPFHNGHSAGCIKSVAGAPDGARVFTTCYGKDPFVRVWDVKASKSLAPIPLPGGEDDRTSRDPDIASFPVNGKIAVAASFEAVTILDPTGKEKSFDLTDESFPKDCSGVMGGISGGLAISPDERFLACKTTRRWIVVWNVKSRKMVFANNMVPDGIEYRDWTTDDLEFLKSGTQLVLVNHGRGDEVPEGKDEKDVPAEKRALYLIDIPKKQVTPLGMGHQIHTATYSVHPSEDWIATCGMSRPDKKEGKDAAMHPVNELRFYRFSTRSLALRIQFGEDFAPTMIKFTPDGKKLIGIDPDGKVRIWDFTTQKP